MKSTTLTIAFLCLVSSLAFTQLKVDISTGITYLNTELSGIRNGFYVSASPSIPFKNKFRVHATVQYRKRTTDYLNDVGNLDLNPMLEYEAFKFLSFSGGLYYSFNLNSSGIVGFKPTAEFGPVASVKFKFKSAFAIIGYSKPIIDELESFFEGSDSFFSEKSFFSGTFQFGLGYRFGKKSR